MLSTRFRWFLTATSFFSGVSIGLIFLFTSLKMIESFCPKKYLVEEMTCGMIEPNLSCSLPLIGNLERWVFLAAAIIAAILAVVIPVKIAPSHKNLVGVFSGLLVIGLCIYTFLAIG
jgi:hypothetical protein